MNTAPPLERAHLKYCKITLKEAAGTINATTHKANQTKYYEVNILYLYIIN
jgi:hypothetical protein